MTSDPGHPGKQAYDRWFLLGERRNELLALHEVQQYGRDSFGDPDHVSIYGLKPHDWYARGVRILGRTAVECTPDRLADLIGRDEDQLQMERIAGAHRMLPADSCGVGRQPMPWSIATFVGMPALLLALAVPAQAQITSSAQADHWGAFFGDQNNADRDLTSQPQSLTFPAPVVQLGTSNSTQYALLADGTLWAWGQGTNGQLGNGADENSLTTPVQVQFPPGVLVASLPVSDMPFDTALAIDTNGNAWGWGLNRGGELCLGDTTAYDTPQELPLTGVTALAGAAQHAVYDAAGTVETCGKNADGVAGIGSHSRVLALTPEAVTGLPPGVAVTQLYSAYNNDGALLANGKYYDWGYNAAGQVGNGRAPVAASRPARVRIHDTSPVTQVALGGSTKSNGQTLVMLADGTMWAWGDDSNGQLGDGSTVSQNAPEEITPPPGLTYVTLAAGGSTSYAIDADGNVWAWGWGKGGQLGTGRQVESLAPVEADSGAVMISSTASDVVVAS